MSAFLPKTDVYRTSSQGGLFVFNSHSVRMNQDHRSGADKRQRFDHPPPWALTGRPRGSKSDPDARNRMSALAPNELTSSARAATSEKCRYCCKTPKMPCDQFPANRQT